jgi:hypothetical protein
MIHKISDQWIKNFNSFCELTVGAGTFPLFRAAMISLIIAGAYWLHGLSHGMCLQTGGDLYN